DAPSFTKGPNQTVLENSGEQIVAGWATQISAGPTNEAAQLVDFIVTADQSPLFAVQPAVSANGALTFTPAANANGSTVVHIKAHDNGGVVNGGIDTSGGQTFTIAIGSGENTPRFSGR